MPEERGNRATLRKTLYLGATCVALGGLCSGVKGGGVVFGMLAGAFLYGMVGGIAILLFYAAN